MKYKSYVSILFAVNLLFLAAGLYLFFNNGGQWYIAIIPFAILTVALFVLREPIDRYFFRFQEVDIVDKLYHALSIDYPMLQDFTLAEEKEFRHRLFHFLYGRSFYLVSSETEELDELHSALICTPAVIMSMPGSADRATDIERIAAYRHAFPSPKMQFIHAAEYDHEDGVIIVSLEQLMLCTKQPQQYYSIIFHVWAERFINRYRAFPKVPHTFVDSFTSIFGFNKEKAEQFLGLTIEDERTIALVAYFVKKNNLQLNFPDFYKAISEYLIRR